MKDTLRTTSTIVYPEHSKWDQNLWFTPYLCTVTGVTHPSPPLVTLSLFMHRSLPSHKTGQNSILSSLWSLRNSISNHCIHVVLNMFFVQAWTLISMEYLESGGRKNCITVIKREICLLGLHVCTWNFYHYLNLICLLMFQFASFLVNYKGAETRTKNLVMCSRKT